MKQKYMFFLNSLVLLLLLFMIQRMLVIWSLVPLPCLNPACISGSSWFIYCWSLTWRILSITLLNKKWVQLYGSLNILWHYLSLRLEWKLKLFLFCGHCWVFQSCWHIEWSTLTASSFRICNSSAGIPSPPLVLLIVMLPKAHLTSHSTMSGSRWVITPLWLSVSWRSDLETDH